MEERQAQDVKILKSRNLLNLLKRKRLLKKSKCAFLLLGGRKKIISYFFVWTLTCRHSQKLKLTSGLREVNPKDLFPRRAERNATERSFNLLFNSCEYLEQRGITASGFCKAKNSEELLGSLGRRDAVLFYKRECRCIFVFRVWGCIN